MHRVETQPSSKRFVKKRLEAYHLYNAVDKTLEKSLKKSKNCESLSPEIFLLNFQNYVEFDLVRKGASFGKIRDAYEKTVLKLVTLSKEEKDQLATKTAGLLVSQGEHVLKGLNPEFDSDEWYEAQREVVYPEGLHFPRKSDSVYS